MNGAPVMPEALNIFPKVPDGAYAPTTAVKPSNFGGPR